MTKQIIAQNPSPPSQPVSSPDIFATYGVFGGTLIALAIALVTGLPKYVDSVVKRREQERAAQQEAENRERLSQLQREEKLYDTVLTIINTLLANLLQTTTEQREKYADQLSILSQQVMLMLQHQEKYLQNQQSLFPIAQELKQQLQLIAIEIAKIKRGTTNDRPQKDTP
jgi:hypothetical protein